jgi:branched-chain amino acid transport system substrate-binding protein
MVDQNIQALTGGIWNPMSAALNEECKINPVIYIPGYVPAMDSYKEGNPSDCTFTPTFTPWSIGYISGQSAIQSLGKKTIFYVERADSWGTTIRQGLEAACEEYGGEIVGTAEVSKGTVDYSSIINEAKSLDPDIFITSMFGGDAIANLKQAYDQGLYEETVMFNTWTANIVAKGIPGRAMEDLYALAWFYWNLEGLGDPEIVEKVKAYSDAYRERWNEPPDNMGTAAYVAAEITFQAIEKAGTFDPESVAAVIAEEEFDTVKGKLRFREDHQPVVKHASFLLRGKAPNEKEGEWDFFEVIESFGGEEVLPPLDVMGY